MEKPVRSAKQGGKHRDSLHQHRPHTAALQLSQWHQVTLREDRKLKCILRGLGEIIITKHLPWPDNELHLLHITSFQVSSMS